MKEINSKITFDFDNMSLNATVIGDGLYDEKLGIQINKNSELGYSVNVVNGVVDNIFISITPSFNDGYSAFLGSFKIRGEILNLDKISSTEYVKSNFGKPVSHWNDGVEENLQFIVMKYRIEFSWNVGNLNTCLSYVSVESECVCPVVPSRRPIEC